MRIVYWLSKEGIGCSVAVEALRWRLLASIVGEATELGMGGGRAGKGLSDVMADLGLEDFLVLPVADGNMKLKLGVLADCIPGC